MENILIIEDEKDIAELIAFNLQLNGYNTAIALDGISGLETARCSNPDLILLDLMLPGLLGTDICKILKASEKLSNIPIIIISAKGEEIDRVVGFEIGADDYVAKPFSSRELLLRIKAVLRRSHPEKKAGKIIKVGQIVIDTEGHLVTVEGEEVFLTTTEFKLLQTLAEGNGTVKSRDSLLKDGWGLDYIGESRTVDTHLARLRTKLGKCGEYIKTIRGFGYKLEV